MIIVIRNALVLNFVQNSTFSTIYCIYKNTKKAEIKPETGRTDPLQTEKDAGRRIRYPAGATVPLFRSITRTI